MDNSHWWLIKLAVIQLGYLAVVLWGMRALNQKLARVRVDRSVLNPAAARQQQLTRHSQKR
jgi:hypothetical protein